MFTDLESILLTYIILLLFPIQLARNGVREAFEYKKSNTKVKNERKEISFWRKLLCWYKPEETKAPWHMKLFQALRIFYAINISSAIVYLVFSQHLSYRLVWLIVLPGGVATLSFYTYTLAVLRKLPSNRFNFENAKRQ